MSVLPLLRLNDPKRALKKAMEAGATGLTAALLEELNGGSHRRAVDDLRL